MTDSKSFEPCCEQMNDSRLEPALNSLQICLAATFRSMAESDVDGSMPVCFDQFDDPRCRLQDSLRRGQQKFPVFAMQTSGVAGDRLSLNAMSFAHNKRHALGLCGNQLSVLDNFVVD